jgi:LytR cell envelope-related transcriptional attenuator
VIELAGPIAGLTDLLDVKLLGALAGFAAFIGVAVLAMVSFAQARDVRRLREWAGSAPERDAGLRETTSTIAAERSEELQKVDEERRRREEAEKAEQRAAALREERRQRREYGMPDESRWQRFRGRFAGSGGRLPAPRYLALIVGAVIVLGGGVAFAAIQVFGGDGEGQKNAAAKSGPRPADIEVAVLNGTAVSGLAGRFGDALEHDGFQLGAVTNSTTSFGTSVVMFSRGHKPEARKAAKALKIEKLQLMTSDVASAAAGAPVAVVVGEDRASSPPTG